MYPTFFPSQSPLETHTECAGIPFIGHCRTSFRSFRGRLLPVRKDRPHTGGTGGVSGGSLGRGGSRGEGRNTFPVTSDDDERSSRLVFVTVSLSLSPWPRSLVLSRVSFLLVEVPLNFLFLGATSVPRVRKDLHPPITVGSPYGVQSHPWYIRSQE